MKKNIILFAIAITGIIIWWQSNASSQPSLPIVGVIQVIGHPALDQTRQGILDELQSQGFTDGQKIQHQLNIPAGKHFIFL